MPCEPADPLPPAAVTSSAPLPHVEQYEVVWPQRLPGPRTRRALPSHLVSLVRKLAWGAPIWPLRAGLLKDCTSSVSSQL